MIMQKLPILSGHKIIKILSSIGFNVVGQKGSHVRMKKKKTQTNVWIVVVPLHNETSIGTYRSILKQAGLTKEEFIRLYEKNR